MRDTILIVEDDEMICQGIVDALQLRNWKTDVAATCEEAEKKIKEYTYMLYILDMKLPDGNGISLCRKIRTATENPVLFLSAYDNESYIVEGLEAGGDDYVVKPFSMAELSAKIMSFLRRSKGLWEKKSSIEAYDIVIYPDKLQVFVAGNEVRLAPKEYAMLKYFMEHRGMLITRDDLLVRLWGYDYEGSDRVVDNHIKKLRQALGEPGKKIKTVFAKGYRMD